MKEKDQLMRLKSMNDITKEHEAIYLSPHLDDAVYSCGGTIALQASRGERPLVITVFAGIPVGRCGWCSLAFKAHRGMGFGRWDSRESEAIVTMRRQEDCRALDYLGCDYLWLDHLDAIYRGRPAYYKHVQQLVGGHLHPHEHMLVKRIEQELLALHTRLPHLTWYIPLGVGRHLDHQVVYAASECLIACGANVRLYEDFPYVVRDGALDRQMCALKRPFEPLVVEIAQMLHVREAAAMLYTSQISMCFSNKEMMQHLLERYTRGLVPGGEPVERYWLPT